MLSVPHLIVIFVVVLIIFGPEKLPELARNFGKVMVEIRRVTGDLRSTMDGHLRDIEREVEEQRAGNTSSASAPAPAAPSPPPPAIVAAPGIIPSGAPRATPPEGEAEGSASAASEPSIGEPAGTPAPSDTSEPAPGPNPAQESQRVNNDVGARPA